MLAEARQMQTLDIPATVKCLVNEQAIVVGGVCPDPGWTELQRCSSQVHTSLCLMQMRAYIPYSSLQAVLDMLLEARQRQIVDILAIVKCLVNKHVIVLGGVRQLPAGR